MIVSFLLYYEKSMFSIFSPVSLFATSSILFILLFGSTLIIQLSFHTGVV